MLPRVIIHNSISIDGSLTNFEVNMQLHYQLAGSFEPDMLLVGSNTAKSGIEMFLEDIPEETDEDFKKPEKQGILWATPDSSGKLYKKLHFLRQSEYCRDVIVFVSEKTPEEYINYLKERDYDYYVCGSEKCNLKNVLNILYKEYNAGTILTDAGSLLGNMLIEHGLVTEISLLVHPVIVGKKSLNIFGNINRNQNLKLLKKEIFEDGYIWLTYNSITV